MISMSFTLNYMPQLNKFLSKNKTVNVSYDHFAWSCRFTGLPWQFFSFCV